MFWFNCLEVCSISLPLVLTMFNHYSHIFPLFIVFLEILHWYFKEKLGELSAIMDEDDIEEHDSDCMDLDEKLRCKNGEMDVDDGDSQGKNSRQDELVKNIGEVVRDLRSIGFTSMAENAYASAIFLLLKVFYASEIFICLTETYNTVYIVIICI